MTIYDFAFLFLLALIVALWRALVLANRDIEKLKHISRELSQAVVRDSESRDLISAIAGVIKAMRDELRDEFQKELNEQEKVE